MGNHSMWITEPIFFSMQYYILCAVLNKKCAAENVQPLKLDLVWSSEIRYYRKQWKVEIISDLFKFNSTFRKTRRNKILANKIKLLYFFFFDKLPFFNNWLNHYYFSFLFIRKTVKSLLHSAGQVYSIENIGPVGGSVRAIVTLQYIYSVQHCMGSTLKIECFTKEIRNICNVKRTLLFSKREKRTSCDRNISFFIEAVFY